VIVAIFKNLRVCFSIKKILPNLWDRPIDAHDNLSPAKKMQAATFFHNRWLRIYLKIIIDKVVQSVVVNQSPTV